MEFYSFFFYDLLLNRQIQYFFYKILIGSSNYFLNRTWGFAGVACGMRASFLLLLLDSDR